MQSKYYKEKLKKLNKIFDWNKEEKLADQDIKSRRVKTFHNFGEAIRWLKKNAKV